MLPKKIFEKVSVNKIKKTKIKTHIGWEGGDLKRPDIKKYFFAGGGIFFQRAALGDIPFDRLKWIEEKKMVLSSFKENNVV